MGPNGVASFTNVVPLLAREPTLLPLVEGPLIQGVVRLAIQARKSGAANDHDAGMAPPVLDADENGRGPSPPPTGYLTGPIGSPSVGPSAPLIGPAVARPPPVPEETGAAPEVETKAGDGPDKAPEAAAARETRDIIPEPFAARRAAGGVPVEDAALDPAAADIENVLAAAPYRGTAVDRGVPAMARQASARPQVPSSAREVAAVAVASEAIYGEGTALEVPLETPYLGASSVGAPT